GCAGPLGWEWGPVARAGRGGGAPGGPGGGGGATPRAGGARAGGGARRERGAAPGSRAAPATDVPEGDDGTDDAIEETWTEWPARAPGRRGDAAWQAEHAADPRPRPRGPRRPARTGMAERRVPVRGGRPARKKPSRRKPRPA